MHAPLFARAIRDAGAPADCCICFIDGTFRACAKPTYAQEHVYSGYYKAHGVKFQSVVAPNGLIIELFGPHPGRHPDRHMLAESRLEERMRQLSGLVGDGRVYHLYGDPVYAEGQYMMRGYKGSLTAQQAYLTHAMNALT